MARKKNTEANAPTPEQAQEHAQALVKQAFEFLNNGFKQLADDRARFNDRQKKIREGIERGARKTNGRIV